MRSIFTRKRIISYPRFLLPTLGTPWRVDDDRTPRSRGTVPQSAAIP